MKTIIAGSRGITNPCTVMDAILASGWLEEISEVVSGGARGVDRLGEEFAKTQELGLKVFPAEWDRYGKSAGYRRNVQMAEYADALIAVTNGSKGTGHMINIARERGLKVFVSTMEEE